MSGTQGSKPDTGKLHSSYIGMNVCGSAYENGCIVNATTVNLFLDLISSYLVFSVFCL